MIRPTNPACAEKLGDDNGVGGWISPDGVFYQAEYWEHARVAGEIAWSVFGRHGMHRASDFLISLGWIRLETEGYIRHTYNSTYSMFCTLPEIICGTSRRCTSM